MRALCLRKTRIPRLLGRNRIPIIRDLVLVHKPFTKPSTAGSPPLLVYGSVESTLFFVSSCIFLLASMLFHMYSH